MKNRYEIRGEVTAIFLKLKNGTFIESMIDTEDLEKVDSLKTTWHAVYQRDIKSHYAQGYFYKDGKSKTVCMHRLIMSVVDPRVKVDHVNHSTLDNRKSNLRTVTNAENLQNRIGANSNSKSGVRGVHWSNHHQKWTASMRLNYKSIFLGRYDTIEEAEKVAVQARKEKMKFTNN